MTFHIAALALTIIGLLALSAFFSGSETALTALSKARMHHLANEGSRRAQNVNILIADRERLIGALLLGNTFVNILASSLATSLLLYYFREGVAIATVAMTAIIVIFAEVMPKTLAIARADQFALVTALPARIVVTLLAPIVMTVQFIVWQIFGVFGIEQTPLEPVTTAHQEIRGAIDLHHQEGGVESDHRNMLGGVLDLRELKISDVMVHRKNIETIDCSIPANELLEQIFVSAHTRFPVWRDDPENVVGVLHTKDVLRRLNAQRGSQDGLDIEGLMKAPWFVPETTTLEEQLDAFRDEGAHFALVVDEYGTLQGLVTLEDILEEVFGNISESRDTKGHEGIRPQPDGSYNVDGGMPVRDLNRELSWKLPDEDATTIAGLVIHEAHIIPEPGQVFSFFGFKFEVLRRQRNQITALRITPPMPAADKTEAA